MYNKKKILKVSYPIILGLLAQNIINVTDTAFLGHVGEVELGASAIGGIYYYCFFILAFGFSVGAQILMARRNGEGNHREIGPILTQGSLFILLIAILLLGATFTTARPMLGMMLSSEKIIDAAVIFYQWRAWGFLFSFINTMYRAFYVSITRTKVLTYNAVVMAVVNIFLDWVLIFGELGFPKMGLEGAALASVIAEAVSLGYFIIYTKRNIGTERYNIRFSLRIDRTLIRSILGVSSFLMLQQFVPFATWFVFFLAIEHLGQRELAIANICRSIYILALIPINSFQTTVNTLVSNTIGAGAVDKVRTVINRVTLMSVITGIFFCGLMFWIPELMLRIYTHDPQLITDSGPSLHVIGIALIICAASNVQFSGISGTGSARAAFWIMMPCQLAYILWIIVFTGILKWSVAASFTCEVMYYCLLLTASLLYLKYGNWRNVKI